LTHPYLFGGGWGSPKTPGVGMFAVRNAINSCQKWFIWLC